MNIEHAIKDAVREGMKEAIEELRSAFATLPVRRPTDEMWTMKKAAKVASVSAWTVREWVKLGRIRSYGTGRLLRVRRSEFEGFLNHLGRTEPQTVDADRRAEEILARRRAKR